MTVLLSVETGRDAVALWGYPLWLFLGLWIVLNARPIERVTLWRIVFLWGAIFISTAAVFVTDYGILQRFRPRYTAMVYPGKQLGAEMSRRYRQLTGQPLAYVIGTVWLSGNIAHYAPEQPRVLIDGNPARAPWIDLDDLRTRGAVVVWVAGDPDVLPPMFRAVAGDAAIQPPLTLPLHLGVGVTQVGWALLRPRPMTRGKAEK